MIFTPLEKFNNESKSFLTGFIITLFILFLDQLSKFIITKNLLLNQSVPVIGGIFHLTLVHNRGAAFGILKDQDQLFIFTSLFAIILIFWGLKKNKCKKHSLYPVRNTAFAKGFGKISNGVYNISLNFILAGALGNLIDRLTFGYVIDFLDFRIWPVFNIADSAITVGAILLGWSILFNDKCQNSKHKINPKSQCQNSKL